MFLYPLAFLRDYSQPVFSLEISKSTSPSSPLLILSVWPYFLFHWESRLSEKSFFKFLPPHPQITVNYLPSLLYLWTICTLQWCRRSIPLQVFSFCLFLFQLNQFSTLYWITPLSIQTSPDSYHLKGTPFGTVFSSYLSLEKVFSGIYSSQASILSSLLKLLLIMSLGFPTVKHSGQFCVFILLDLLAAFHITSCLNYCITFLNGILAPVFAALFIFYSEVSVLFLVDWVMSFLSSYPSNTFQLIQGKSWILTMAHGVLSGLAPFPPCLHCLALSFLCSLCSSFRASSPLLLIHTASVPTSETLLLQPLPEVSMTPSSLPSGLCSHVTLSQWLPLILSSMKE